MNTAIHRVLNDLKAEEGNEKGGGMKDQVIGSEIY